MNLRLGQFVRSGPLVLIVLLTTGGYFGGAIACTYAADGNLVLVPATGAESIRAEVPGQQNSRLEGYIIGLRTPATELPAAFSPRSQHRDQRQLRTKSQSVVKPFAPSTHTAVTSSSGRPLPAKATIDASNPEDPRARTEPLVVSNELCPIPKAVRYSGEPSRASETAPFASETPFQGKKFPGNDDTSPIGGATVPLAAEPRRCPLVSPANNSDLASRTVPSLSHGAETQQLSQPVHLPRCESPSPQRPSLVHLGRRAEPHIRYAFALAERGATYSAQAEFTFVLKLVAEALDQETDTNFHGQAVTAGLRALREAEDFASRGLNAEDGVDLSRCIAVHRTPVLKDKDTANTTLMEALQLYHAFASQQLALAGAQEPTASMALYGLGRLQSVLNVGHGVRRNTAGTNAMAMYQAALAVDPNNYMAANELGVLFARYGETEYARVLLLHSLAICENPQTWHNLSVLYHELGLSDDAAWAEQRGRICAAAQKSSESSTGQGPPVYWVDPETLASNTGFDESIGAAMPTPSAASRTYGASERNRGQTQLEHIAGESSPGISSEPSRFDRIKSLIGLGRGGVAPETTTGRTSQFPSRQGIR